MKISETFPSPYLRASDLDGRAVKATIADCTLEPLDGEPKPVLHFRGKEKGLVLNKTNSSTIAAAYSDETQEWNGKEIELFTDRVMFQGSLVDAIRVRVSAPALIDPGLDDIPF